MKIITGKFRNRVIPTHKKSDYRPTTAKFREALFSILSSGGFVDSKPLEGAIVLDLFAGTGSLSFEALSRGAAHATLVDISEENLGLAKQFAEKLDCLDNIKLIIGDATCASRLQHKYSLVFMDPPYHKDYAAKTLINLDRNDLLERNAIIAIEMSKYDKFTVSGPYEMLREKIYGNSRLLILKYIGSVI